MEFQISEEIAAHISEHPNLDKLNRSREQLAVLFQFMRWLNENRNYEICHLQHVSYTDKKVHVRIPEKPEWLIADFLGIDFKALNAELKGSAGKMPISSLSTEQVMQMFKE